MRPVALILAAAVVDPPRPAAPAAIITADVVRVDHRGQDTQRDRAWT